MLDTAPGMHNWTRVPAAALVPSRRRRLAVWRSCSLSSFVTHQIAIDVCSSLLLTVVHAVDASEEGERQKEGARDGHRVHRPADEQGMDGGNDEDKSIIGMYAGTPINDITRGGSAHMRTWTLHAPFTEGTHACRINIHIRAYVTCVQRSQVQFVQQPAVSLLLACLFCWKAVMFQMRSDRLSARPDSVASSSSCAAARRRAWRGVRKAR